jgi:hypothetical protein
MTISITVLFVVVITVLFAIGFYIFVKRFWVQDRNSSRTAPPAPPEGIGNKLDDHNPIWRPPRAS